MVTRPRSGRRKPSRQPRKVVLPAPFGPMIPNTSPGAIVSVTPSSACTRSPASPRRYDLLSDSTSMPVTRSPSRESTACRPVGKTLQDRAPILPAEREPGSTSQPHLGVAVGDRQDLDDLREVDDGAAVDPREAVLGQGTLELGQGHPVEDLALRGVEQDVVAARLDPQDRPGGDDPVPGSVPHREAIDAPRTAAAG